MIISGGKNSLEGTTRKILMEIVEKFVRNKKVKSSRKKKLVKGNIVDIRS